MAIAIDCVDLATAHAVECAAIEHEKLLAVEAAKARNPRFVHAKAYDDLPRDVLDAVNAFNAASGKHAVAIERKSFAEAKLRKLDPLHSRLAAQSARTPATAVPIPPPTIATPALLIMNSSTEKPMAGISVASVTPPAPTARERLIAAARRNQGLARLDKSSVATSSERTGSTPQKSGPADTNSARLMAAARRQGLVRDTAE